GRPITDGETVRNGSRRSAAGYRLLRSVDAPVAAFERDEEELADLQILQVISHLGRQREGVPHVRSEPAAEPKERVRLEHRDRFARERLRILPGERDRHVLRRALADDLAGRLALPSLRALQ